MFDLFDLLLLLLDLLAFIVLSYFNSILGLGRGVSSLRIGDKLSELSREPPSI